MSQVLSTSFDVAALVEVAFVTDRHLLTEGGMWRRVGLVTIYVSEKRVASIFRVENKRTKKGVSSRPSKMGKTHFLKMIIVTTSSLTRSSLWPRSICGLSCEPINLHWDLEKKPQAVSNCRDAIQRKGYQTVF
jgi:hypothetical protein